MQGRLGEKRDAGKSGTRWLVNQRSCGVLYQVDATDGEGLFLAAVQLPKE